ncbi:MAG: TolC family protein [Acidobacteriota bacterium]
MRRIRWSIWAAGWLLAFAPLSARPQTPTLTLRQAIDRALGQNSQTAVAHADVQAAAAGVSMAKTGLWPRLNFTEDLSRGNDPVYVFGTKLRQQRFAQSDFSLNSLNRPTPVGNFATRFSGQWMLFNWFETQQQMRGAKLGADSAGSMAKAVDQGVVLQVVQAYQAVLYAQRQLEVANHEQQTAEALLHDAQTRVKAGLAIDSDLLSAQVNLAARQQEKIAAEGAVDTAWAELEAAMGGPVNPHPELRPIEAKSFPAGALDEDVTKALAARPDLKALQQQTAAQHQAAKAAWSDYFPQVSAYGNWETDRQTFAGDGGNNWVAGAQINFDILPLSKRAHLAQARAAEAKAAAQERGQEQQIRLAVSRAFTDHQTAERMVATARASMDQSAEGLRILRNRYDAGLATMTDLLRAEDAQRQSQNSYWQAAYGNTVAYAALLYTTGQLTPDTAETLQ